VTTVRIGVDLDNTLACYDRVFHAAALEQGLIPAEGVGTDKVSVRDWLRGQDNDAAFTALQGYVYGPGMRHVSLYPGAAAALAELKAAGCEIWVVSHRTAKPFAGPDYDLHAAARSFLAAQGLVGDAAVLGQHEVFLETTKEAKVARAASLGCEVFIDDLPEILALEGFPPGMRKILFDPTGAHDGGPHDSHRDWPTIARTLLGR
jgi:hypothetical protein